jgi:small subunit ribosomal protein S13
LKVITLSEDFRHIVRIRGADIDGSARVAFGLLKIRGLGVNLTSAISRVLGFEEVQRIEDALSDPKKYGVPSWYLNRHRDRESGNDLHDTGPDLLLRVRSDIERLQKIKSWRGVRHMLGLKVRGQRTRTTGRKGRSVGVKRSSLRQQQQQQS